MDFRPQTHREHIMVAKLQRAQLAAAQAEREGDAEALEEAQVDVEKYSAIVEDDVAARVEGRKLRNGPELESFMSDVVQARAVRLGRISDPRIESPRVESDPRVESPDLLVKESDNG